MRYELNIDITVYDNTARDIDSNRSIIIEEYLKKKKKRNIVV